MNAGWVGLYLTDNWLWLCFPAGALIWLSGIAILADIAKNDQRRGTVSARQAALGAALVFASMVCGALPFIAVLAP